jgi:hypothetical protein
MELSTLTINALTVKHLDSVLRDFLLLDVLHLFADGFHFIFK